MSSWSRQPKNYVLRAVKKTPAVSALNQIAPLPSPVDAGLFLNPELSLLQFQRRILEEARDACNPLLERVKFLSILSSNLDEFFMVRVAGLLQQIESGVRELSIDGRPPGAQLEAIRAEVTSLLAEAYAAYQQELLPALASAGIHIANYRWLSAGQRQQLEAYFLESIYPVLTPLAFDRGRPFPHISNLSLNLAVVVRDRDGAEHFARVKVPDSINQLVPVPKDAGRPSVGDAFVWLEHLILANLHYLFPGLKIIEAHPFHVTRDAEVAIKEIETDDLLETIEDAVWQRRFRDVVRLQVNASMPEPLLELLTSNLEIDPSGVYCAEAALDLGRLRQLTGLERPDLKDRPFTPQATQLDDEEFFAAIRHEEVLLHHPFDSFQPVVEFLQRAARDPNVLAIKMTLYRLGRDSPIVDALLEAIRNGKQVAVVVELQARFDEKSNIEWARTLEREGVHVVHGLPGLKVHSKIALVVRREGDAIRRYLHLASGNYNPTTARLYTDMGLFTCDPEIGADATALFNYLTGYTGEHRFRKLLVAPVNLRERLAELIRREIDHQRHGRVGRLIFKMNGLDDPGMIRLLSEASCAGVQVDLLVRGICSLRPGIPGVTENIRVTSIVGRFLEHSRIFCFANGGHEEIYLGSADLMPRNLNRRVEVLFPVSAPRLVARLHDEVLQVYLADDAGARHMRSDGSYTPKSLAGKRDSQAWFMAQRTARGNTVDRKVMESPQTAPAICVAPSSAHGPLQQAVSVLAGDIAQCLVAVVEQASRRFYRDLDTVHVQVERSVEQVRAVVRTEQQGIAAVNRRNASLEMAVESLRGSAASRSAEIEALRNRLQELRAAARAVSNA
ncbi:MAG TPA: polyphosphate kinase 1 [Bryobacteraceae bacterium]|nr:polyphosphate kinase 1 [Bryobacteraceae bacterium]